ncbi:MAG: hypothetical protein PXY39_02865 [archaeon]|nr:hypothetical protein [archaeon]
MKPILVKELEGSRTVTEQVEEFLKSHPSNRCSIQRLMIELFGRREEDILGSFSDWKTSDSTLYSRITRALKNLEENGKVSEKHHEKAMVYYWKQ